MRKCTVALAVWLALTLALRPLAVPDEGRYVGVAWEMLTSGNWLVPTLNGLPYFHKPPLFYWMTAAAIAAFGPGMIAARMASWLAAVALGAGLFAFTRRWFGADVARRALLVFATMPLCFGGAQFANLDMLVASCIGLGILSAVHAVLTLEQGGAARWPIAGSFAMAGLGLLAKGLIGLVLPALVVIAWAIATRRIPSLLRLLATWYGWLLLAGIAAPWFIAMNREFDGFAHYFFVVQHFQRFADSTFNNVQPFWFYVPVLLIGAAPWSVLAIARWKHAAGASDAAARGLTTMLLIWLGCVVLFFSLPHSKLVGYVFPVLAPASVLVALSTRGLSAASLRAVAAVSAALCLVLVGTVAHVAPKSEAPLALQMRRDMAPGDEVAFVDGMYFDVPYEARLKNPVLVVDRWSPQDTAKDNWRRELIDAQAFASGTPSRLLHPPDLVERLCAFGRPTWILGPRDGGSAAWLATLAPRGTTRDAALWRVDPGRPAGRAALACPARWQGDEKLVDN